MRPPIRDGNVLLKATVFQLCAEDNFVPLRSECVQLLASTQQIGNNSISRFARNSLTSENHYIAVCKMCGETPVFAASSEEVVLCGEAPSG